MITLADKQLTNALLIDELDLWFELDNKSIDDEDVKKYYQIIDDLIDSQINESINWLDSEEARDYFFNDIELQKEIFDALEDAWDEILSNHYDTVDELLDTIYDHGKKRGYGNIRETIRYTDADRQAIRLCKDYNFHLIRKLSNDLRSNVKDKILQGIISGENPYNLAKTLVDVGVKPLKDSTFTARQRATMIAKTETSRMQNTGMLQSYINEGYTQVKILTAEDDNVCHTCLQYAYEFNNDDNVTFATRGHERVHNIIKLIKGGLFPPFHPNCRCTYLVVWETKEKPSKNPYIIDLTPDDYQFANYYPEVSDFFKKYKAPKGSKPVIFPDEKLKEEFGGIIDSNDIPLVLKLLNKFNNTVLNCDYEWIIGETTKGFSPKLAYSDWKKTKVNLQYSLRNLDDDEKLLTVIHNHIWGMTPLPSDKDLKLYLNHEIKYGIITNEMGVFVVRNDNTKKLSQDKINDLLDDLSEIDDSIIEKFENAKEMNYDLENDNHKYLLNEYLKDNFEYWADEYEYLLANYNMKVKFINAKKVNTI